MVRPPHAWSDETEKSVDIRALDEWMYAIQCVLNDSDSGDDSLSAESVSLLNKVLDDMRERRAKLGLERHNEHGY